MILTKYGKSMIPIKFTWEMTEACNLNCIHCYCRATKEPLPKELSFHESKELLYNLINNNVLYLLLDGGEPLLRPDFFDILRLSTANMCTWISTNGSLIDKSAASEIAKSRTGAVFVSLQSSDKETHEFITKTTGSYIATLKGMENLVEKDVRTIMCSVLMKPNLNYVEDFIHLAEELNVYKVIFLRPYNIGKGKDNKELIIPDLDEIKNAVERIERTAQQSTVQVSHAFGRNNHYCCFQAFSVDSQGYAMNCPYLRELPRIGNIRNQSLWDIWDSEEAKKIRYSYLDVQGKCKSCDMKERCNGGCRSSAYFISGDITAVDPFCWL